MSISNPLVSVYNRLNEIDFACQLFDKSQEKTVVIWSAMILGYMHNGLTEMAISLFQEMMPTDFNPNLVIITTIYLLQRTWSVPVVPLFVCLFALLDYGVCMWSGLGIHIC